MATTIETITTPDPVQAAVSPELAKLIERYHQLATWIDDLLSEPRKVSDRLLDSLNASLNTLATSTAVAVAVKPIGEPMSFESTASAVCRPVNPRGQLALA